MRLSRSVVHTSARRRAVRSAITVSSVAALALAVVSSASAAGASVVSTPCAAAGQKLGNPGFETGAATPWTSTPGVIENASGGESAHTGTFVAWLDGYATTHTDTLSQPVAVPLSCASEVFSFWLHINTEETTTTTAFDKLQVQVVAATGTTTLATFSNLNHATGYQQHSYNLAPWAGKSVTLKFVGTEDASQQTSFVIDDTAATIS